MFFSLLVVHLFYCCFITFTHPFTILMFTILCLPTFVVFISIAKGLPSFVTPPLVLQDHYMWLEFICFLEHLNSFEIENT
jgi:hypothetical protein